VKRGFPKLKFGTCKYSWPVSCYTLSIYFTKLADTTAVAAA